MEQHAFAVRPAHVTGDERADLIVGLDLHWFMELSLQELAGREVEPSGLVVLGTTAVETRTWCATTSLRHARVRQVAFHMRLKGPIR